MVVGRHPLECVQQAAGAKLSVGHEDPSDQGLDVGVVRSPGGFCSTVI